MRKLQKKQALTQNPNFSLKQEALPGCLEEATTNLLLDNFGCGTTLQIQQPARRQLGGLRGRLTRPRDITQQYESEEERMFAELLLRENEDRRFLADGMSMQPSSCDYDVDVRVPNIIALGK